MKKGWEITRLGDVCEIFDNGNWIESKDQAANGFRLIQTGNVGVGEFKNKPGKERYVSEETFKRLKCTEIFEGDILISRLPGPVGRACIVPPSNLRMITAVDCTIVRLKTDILLPRFFTYYAQSESYFKSIAEKITGTTRNRISRSNLGTIKITVPPLHVQQQLISILDKIVASIDHAKENVQRNLQNAKDIYSSTLQQMFLDKKKGWVERELGDVCSLYQGIAINAKTQHALVRQSELPLLRIKDLKNNTVEQYIDPSNYPPHALVNETDIIYTRTGSLGLVFTGRKGVLHNNSFKIVPDKEVERSFLFTWLQNPVFKSKIVLLASKAAQPDITHALFKQQKISIPSRDEQKEIVCRLEALLMQTKKLENIYQKKTGHLEELKKSILQKAFRGELIKRHPVAIT